MQKLIDRIKIISSADNIVDMENSIRKQIRYACKPEHVSIATERLEGWWYQECIKALSSYNPVFTTQRQLQSKIFEITRQYDDNNLPIEFWDLDPIEEEIDRYEKVQTALDEVDSQIDKLTVDQDRLIGNN